MARGEVKRPGCDQSNLEGVRYPAREILVPFVASPTAIPAAYVKVRGDVMCGNGARVCDCLAAWRHPRGRSVGTKCTCWRWRGGRRGL